MKVVKVDDIEIVIDVTSYVKWENRANKEGKTVAQLLSFFLSNAGTTNP